MHFVRHDLGALGGCHGRAHEMGDRQDLPGPWSPAIELAIAVFSGLAIAAPLLFLLTEGILQVARWSRSAQRTLKIALIAAFIIGALVVLNQLPGILRRRGEENAIYRHCMNAQPSIDTISEWFTQSIECRRAASEQMQQRGK
jgi:hypothetical protein